MDAGLSVTVGPLHLKNPVMAGSGEATMDRDGIRAAVDAGAAAVVAKSTNESGVAAEQLAAAEYVLLDDRWEPLPWGPAPRSATLFNRSGLPSVDFDQWAELLADLDRHAQRMNSYVVPSLIVSDPGEAARRAKDFEAAGLRWLELNVGAPHAQEAVAGAIRAASTPTAVSELVRPIREAVSIPLTVKLGGDIDAVEASATAISAGADAVCLSGRYMGFVPDLASRRPVLGTFGAVGGAWALPMTLRSIAKVRHFLGPDVPVIGTNGARDGRDVARFLLAGASAVQMTTAVMTEGPAALTRAIEELAKYLGEQDTDAAGIIGDAADNVMTYEQAMREQP
ncbi:MAG TPA: tRNA-dihydrouridine synthase [Actinomycetota bacterium]|nr:tRNA-dihydrouridine synthase [Actinomycetota bacterium]